MGLYTAKQLLEKHRSEIYADIFLIQRLGSFRAQMKRAVMLVRTCRKKQIFQPGTTLLIIGGGVSGIAAGLEAEKHGVIVTLFEAEEQLFSVQRNCSTRFMHPHEYDWPRSHYQESSYPFLARDQKICPVQMKWESGLASDVVDRMAKEVMSQKTRSFGIDLGVKRMPVSLDTLRSNFDPEDEYDFILICAGGIEKNRINEFTSFRYWENDNLEDQSLEIKTDRVRKILISGGADGGLQDFLRIIHKNQKSEPFAAGKMFDRLADKLNSFPDFRDWYEKRRKDCSSSRPRPEMMWRDLNHLLSLLEKDAARWRFLRDTVIENVKTAIVRGGMTVQLVYRGVEFSESFALNAFLVLLVDRVFQKNNFLRPNCKPERVASFSAGHICSGSPSECASAPHNVFFDGPSSNLSPPETFDLVVIRHGSTPNAG